MLPLLGPSDVRDGIGSLPDRFMSLEAQITGSPRADERSLRIEHRKGSPCAAA
jgi:ABC-type transporter lipoprotein component MlaA